MKMYITSRFSDAAASRAQIEQLCTVVREAGIEDFNFIRDIEHFEPHFFTTQRDVWAASKNALKACDALLIDISDNPSGGRVVEVGMAFALGKPVYVVMKKGVVRKDFYDGIATGIFEYETHGDITKWLSRHDHQIALDTLTSD